MGSRKKGSQRTSHSTPESRIACSRWRLPTKHQGHTTSLITFTVTFALLDTDITRSLTRSLLYKSTDIIRSNDQIVSDVVECYK